MWKGVGGEGTPSEEEMVESALLAADGQFECEDSAPPPVEIAGDLREGKGAPLIVQLFGKLTQVLEIARYHGKTYRNIS